MQYASCMLKIPKLPTVFHKMCSFEHTAQNIVSNCITIYLPLDSLFECNGMYFIHNWIMSSCDINVTYCTVVDYYYYYLYFLFIYLFIVQYDIHLLH